MSKKESTAQEAANSGGMNVGANDSITMLPADVKFDSSGRVLVTNDKVNEFIKESLVRPGAVTLTPGAEENLFGINIFCPKTLNIKCKPKED